MIVVPLRRQSPASQSRGLVDDAPSRILDEEPELFRFDEMDTSFVERTAGKDAQRLKRVAAPVTLQPESGTEVAVTLDSFILFGTAHTNEAQQELDQREIDFLVTFVSFTKDSAIVGEILEFLHRPSRCTKMQNCIDKGHGGLCLKINSEIEKAVQRVIAAKPLASSTPSLEFRIRGDGVFSLKPIRDDGLLDTSRLTYGPQKGRTRALVISRFTKIDLPEPEFGLEPGSSSFRWRTTERVWVVSMGGQARTSSALPSKMLKNKIPTLFNDLTMLSLLVIQQGFAVAELRSAFDTISSRAAGDVIIQAQQSRSFALRLLAFRNSTWRTTMSLSPDLTDYLNDMQQALRLPASFQSLMDDFNQWNSQLELLAQAEGAAASERNGTFFAYMGICIAVGALCFQQGTMEAMICSAVAILSALVFLSWNLSKGIFRRRLMRRSKAW